MSMLKSLPTTLWMVGATVAVAAFSPVVGGAVTATAPVAAPPAAPPAVQPTAQPTAQPSVQKPSTPAQSSKPPVIVDSPAGGAVVKRAVTSLGATAVDADGYTLYLSVLDSTDPPRSVCVSQKCLTAWKPVYLAAGAQPTAGAGVDQSKLGRVKRPDGDWQATLGGWPLYRYYEDPAPGAVTGEGLKGTWHAIGPDGKRVVR